jgi:hypothetical protein
MIMKPSKRLKDLYDSLGHLAKFGADSVEALQAEKATVRAQISNPVVVDAQHCRIAGTRSPIGDIRLVMKSGAVLADFDPEELLRWTGEMLPAIQRSIQCEQERCGP